MPFFCIPPLTWLAFYYNFFTITHLLWILFPLLNSRLSSLISRGISNLNVISGRLQVLVHISLLSRSLKIAWSQNDRFLETGKRKIISSTPHEKCLKIFPSSFFLVLRSISSTTTFDDVKQMIFVLFYYSHFHLFFFFVNESAKSWWRDMKISKVKVDALKKFFFECYYFPLTIANRLSRYHTLISYSFFFIMRGNRSVCLSSYHSLWLASDSLNAFSHLYYL